MTVAIKINRPGRFDPAELQLPANLRIGALSIFAGLSADQSEFGLWGDFLSTTRHKVLISVTHSMIVFPLLLLGRASRAA